MLRLNGTLVIGAAMFLTIIGCHSPEAPAEQSAIDDFTPALSCEHPIIVAGTFDPRAPGYIVSFHLGTDASTATQTLADMYGFTPRFVYTTLPGFAAILDSTALAGVRCAPEVQAIEHDQVLEVASVGAVGAT